MRTTQASRLCTIVVAEDDRSVVVFATACASVSGEEGVLYEGLWHVHLDCPLGDRAVIDGTCGTAVPYKNVYAAIAASRGES